MGDDVLELADKLWRGEIDIVDIHPVGGYIGGLAEIGPGVAFVPSFANVSAFSTDDGLVLEAVPGSTAPRPFGATALDDEVIDDAMEGETVVKTVPCEEHEVVHRFRRACRVKGDDDVAAVGGDGRGVALGRIDDLLGARICLGHRGSLPGVAG